MNSKKVTHFTAREKSYLCNAKIHIVIIIILIISEGQESYIKAYAEIKGLQFRRSLKPLEKILTLHFTEMSGFLPGNVSIHGLIILPS